MDKYIRDAPIEVKLKLIGSIFDGKIEFDGKTYRTNSYNKVLDLIYEQTNELRGAGKRKEDSQNENPQFSTQTRDRTGMDCSTGVWDQRVYLFRHLGVARYVGAKVRLFLEMTKWFLLFLDFTII